jgi:hypothetical protein
VTELLSWATWSWRNKFLPKDLHDEENFEAMVNKLHMDPENYWALEHAILGI